MMPSTDATTRNPNGVWQGGFPVMQGLKLVRTTMRRSWVCPCLRAGGGPGAATAPGSGRVGGTPLALVPAFPANADPVPQPRRRFSATDPSQPDPACRAGPGSRSTREIEWFCDLEEYKP